MSEFARLVTHWSRCASRRMAMASVVRTSGSTYRKAGARMLIDESGETFGLVSGGCLEEEVARHAAETLRSGKPTLVAFDTRAQLGCRGTVDIFVESLAAETAGHLFSMARKYMAERQTLIGATIFRGGDCAGFSLGSYPIPPDAAVPPLPSAMINDSHAALEADRILTRSYEFDGANSEALFHPIRPPLQLYVFGAGPDAVPLCSFTQQLGWRVTLVVHPSQRPPDPILSASTCVASPEEVSTLPFDSRTAAVVMTHNYGRDLAYLSQLLPAQLPYVGLLGPRSRRECLLGDLASVGVPLDPAILASLHSPVGLNIGADTPGEIALSILAEIKAVFAGRRGGFLRDSRAPIHATEPPAKSLSAAAA